MVQQSFLAAPSGAKVVIVGGGTIGADVAVVLLRALGDLHCRSLIVRLFCHFAQAGERCTKCRVIRRQAGRDERVQYVLRCVEMQEICNGVSEEVKLGRLRVAETGWKQLERRDAHADEVTLVDQLYEKRRLAIQ